MSQHKEPRLHPSAEQDSLGGYVQSSLPVSNGYTLAVYTWNPPCGVSAAKGIVFSMHGVLGHSLFELLAPDANNYRALLRGSIVEKILKQDVIVIAHDHPGHGRSSGLHAYVDSHDHLRDACIDVVEHFKAKQELRGKKTFLMGTSMGGTTAVRVCAKRSDLVDGVALFSPAVRPPDDMFGAYGRFLVACSSLLGALVPKLPVLKLPPSPDPVIRDAVQKDGLVHRGALRVRMAMEFLRVYHEINSTAHDIKFKSVVIMIGGKDIIVSPAGIESFVQRIQCDDKIVCRYDDIGHEVTWEAGSGKVIDQYIQWIKEHVSCQEVEG